MQARHPRAAAPIPPQDHDEEPRDMDAFRFELARRLRRLIGTQQKLWRTCREPCCKRARSCVAQEPVCRVRAARRPMKPEHEARNLARIQRALREQFERMDAEQERAADQSHKKS